MRRKERERKKEERESPCFHREKGRDSPRGVFKGVRCVWFSAAVLNCSSREKRKRNRVSERKCRRDRETRTIVIINHFY